MDRFTPAGVPIHDCDAFGWGMQGGMLQSPTYIAQRGYACGYRAGLASGGAVGSSGGGGDAGWQKALDGEVMPTKPTVSESNAALKKVWRKLGGAVASCLAVILSFGQTVQTAPLGTLNEDSSVVVDVNLSGVSEEIADASNNVLAAANDFTLRASNDVLAAANDFTLRASNDVLAAANDFTLGVSNDVLAAANDFTLGASNDVLAAANDFTLGASNDVLSAANDFTLGVSNDVLAAANDFTLRASNDVLAAANDFTLRASNDVLAAANKYSEGLMGKVSTNGLRSVTDNVCHVTEPRMWFRGDIEWGGSAPRALENQPSFDSGRYRWTWMISGSEADGFSAAGGRDATSLSFAGMGLVSSTASFTAKLQEPTSVSNETFVTTSFVTNGVAEAGRNAYAAAMPSIRDLLAKTNATEISADFATDSLVGRLANDSVGFDVRGGTLVLVDGDEDIWSCENGGGTNTNDVKALIDSEVGGTNAVKGAVSRIPPWLTAESEKPPTQDDVDGKRGLTNFDENYITFPAGDVSPEDFPNITWYLSDEDLLEWDEVDTCWNSQYNVFVINYRGYERFEFSSSYGIAEWVGYPPDGSITVETDAGMTFTIRASIPRTRKITRTANLTAGGLAKFGADGVLEKAAEGVDYIKSHQDISGKQDKILETGILKGGGAGAILPAIPSSSAGELADYRDPLDNACHKTEVTEWVFSDGVARTLYHNQNPQSHLWYWNNFSQTWDGTDASPDGSLVAITESESATFLEFNGGSAGITATRSVFATKGEPFVTTSFVTNRFNKVRVALDSFAGTTVSDLVNALKNALEE